MVVSDADIQAGVDLVTGPNAPEYLGILNEPDGGFYDLPVYSPEEASGLVQLSSTPRRPRRTFLRHPHTRTRTGCHASSRPASVLIGSRSSLPTSTASTLRGPLV
jgi:hypothetical protein